MLAWLTIPLSLLNITNSILHLIGCYLLTSQYNSGAQTPQQVFLINISITEASVNLLQLVLNHTYDTNISWLKHTLKYLKTVRGYGFVCVYFITMIYITLDRLFDILLNIKYPVYWNERRAIVLVLATWCVAQACAVGTCFLQHHAQVQVYDILELYVYPVFGILFIAIATVTYVFIFRKYKQSCVPPVARLSMCGDSLTSSLSTYQMFRKSRFYIPVLLIGTFIVFTAVPDLIQMTFVYLGYHNNIGVETLMRILWALSYLSDAFIYIWVKTSVRRLLKKKAYDVKRWIEDHRIKKNVMIEGEITH